MDCIGTLFKFHFCFITSDRQDEIAEFKVMVLTLEKEMCMMHQQLDKYKETTTGTELLTAEVESISAQLEQVHR